MPTAPPRELKLLTWWALGPGEAAATAAACASDCWIYCAPDASFCSYILSLNAAIKTVNLITIQAKICFKNDHNADLILSLAHPEHMWVICLIGKTYRHNCTWRCLHFKPLSADSDIVQIISCIPNIIIFMKLLKLYFRTFPCLSGSHFLWFLARIRCSVNHT